MANKGRYLLLSSDDSCYGLKMEIIPRKLDLPTNSVEVFGKTRLLPTVISDSGPSGRFVWEEFFSASIRNRHTRVAYLRAVEKFLAWCADRKLALHQIAPAHVGNYLDAHSGAIPTKKLDLAALRKFFDLLVLRHVIVLNPASCVRGERYQVIEGKTPEVGSNQARQLLRSIRLETVVGVRDQAIIGLLIYTAVRVGAIAKLNLGDLHHDGTQNVFRFLEKGGKVREIPARHDLDAMIFQYLHAAGAAIGDRSEPMFRTARGRTNELTTRRMSAIDMCRMVKRRLKEAGLPMRISPHSFRTATITDLLEQGVPLEDVQFLAGHADPRTTRLYDRRQRRVTRNIVERISI